MDSCVVLRENTITPEELKILIVCKKPTTTFVYITLVKIWRIWTSEFVLYDVYCDCSVEIHSNKLIHLLRFYNNLFSHYIRLLYLVDTFHYIKKGYTNKLLPPEKNNSVQIIYLNICVRHISQDRLQF